MTPSATTAAAAARTFRCRSCGQLRRADTATGPLPAVCALCDPDAAARRAAARVHGNANTERRRQEVAQLRARVLELEQLLAFDQRAEARAALVPEPESWRALLRSCVSRLAHARGRDETRDRLLDLAAACRAWARALGTGPLETSDPIGARNGAGDA